MGQIGEMDEPEAVHWNFTAFIYIVERKFAVGGRQVLQM